VHQALAEVSAADLRISIILMTELVKFLVSAYTSPLN
jgi:hypothetical protein